MFYHVSIEVDPVFGTLLKSSLRWSHEGVTFKREDREDREERRREFCVKEDFFLYFSVVGIWQKFFFLRFGQDVG